MALPPAVRVGTCLLAARRGAHKPSVDTPDIGDSPRFEVFPGSRCHDAVESRSDNECFRSSRMATEKPKSRQTWSGTRHVGEVTRSHRVEPARSREATGVIGCWTR